MRLTYHTRTWLTVLHTTEIGNEIVWMMHGRYISTWLQTVCECVVQTTTKKRVSVATMTYAIRMFKCMRRWELGMFFDRKFCGAFSVLHSFLSFFSSKITLNQRKSMRNVNVCIREREKVRHKTYTRTHTNSIEDATKSTLWNGTCHSWFEIEQEKRFNGLTCSNEKILSFITFIIIESYQKFSR